MERQIAALAPDDAGGFERFMRDNRRKLELMQPCLENAFHGWRDVFTARLPGCCPTLEPHRSVDAYLRRFFSDPRTRLAFSFQSKYLGMSPFRCPSLFSILSFLEYEYGVFHPIGGCAAITQALARVAQRLGVEIHLDEPVEELLIENKRAVGVRTARGTYRADSVVMNADFARAMSRLVPDANRRRWTEKKIARKKFSCSTFMLYLGHRRPLRSAASQRLHLARLRAEPGRDRTSPRSLTRSVVLRAKRVRDRSDRSRRKA